MKFLFGFVLIAIIAITSNFAVNGQESIPTTEGPTDGNQIDLSTLPPKGRLFFNFGNPCSSLLGNVFNIGNVKCALLCIFGGTSGGACDANSQCVCAPTA